MYMLGPGALISFIVCGLVYLFIVLKAPFPSGKGFECNFKEDKS